MADEKKCPTCGAKGEARCTTKSGKVCRDHLSRRVANCRVIYAPVVTMDDLLGIEVR